MCTVMLGEILYEGTKTYWYQRVTVDIKIIQHSRFCCLEVILNDPLQGIELPRLYLQVEKLQSLINNIEIAARKADAIERYEVSGKSVTPEVGERIERAIQVKVMTSYIVDHLNLETGKGHFSPVVVMYLMSASPTHSNLTKKFRKRSSPIISKPEGLIPVDVNTMQYQFGKWRNEYLHPPVNIYNEFDHAFVTDMNSVKRSVSHDHGTWSSNSNSNTTAGAQTLACMSSDDALRSPISSSGKSCRLRSHKHHHLPRDHLYQQNMQNMNTMSPRIGGTNLSTSHRRTTSDPIPRSPTAASMQTHRFGKEKEKGGGEEEEEEEEYGGGGDCTCKGSKDATCSSNYDERIGAGGSATASTTSNTSNTSKNSLLQSLPFNLSPIVTADTQITQSSNRSRVRPAVSYGSITQSATSNTGSGNGSHLLPVDDPVAPVTKLSDSKAAANLVLPTTTGTNLSVGDTLGVQSQASEPKHTLHAPVHLTPVHPPPTASHHGHHHHELSLQHQQQEHLLPIQDSNVYRESRIAEASLRQTRPKFAKSVEKNASSDSSGSGDDVSTTSVDGTSAPHPRAHHHQHHQQQQQQQQQQQVPILEKKKSLRENPPTTALKHVHMPFSTSLRQLVSRMEQDLEKEEQYYGYMGGDQKNIKKDGEQEKEEDEKQNMLGEPQDEADPKSSAEGRGGERGGQQQQADSKNEDKTEGRDERHAASNTGNGSNSDASSSTALVVAPAAVSRPPTSLKIKARKDENENIHESMLI